MHTVTHLLLEEATNQMPQTIQYIIALVIILRAVAHKINSSSYIIVRDCDTSREIPYFHPMT